jgi:hypothetical protein
MSEYTPGPWSLVDRGYTYIVSGGIGYITRDVCRMDGSTMAALEQRANARLIAAAPATLEALELVRSIIAEGAMVGFNPLGGGDWAERLFLSQATTVAAVKQAGGNVHTFKATEAIQ